MYISIGLFTYNELGGIMHLDRGVSLRKLQSFDAAFVNNEYQNMSPPSDSNVRNSLCMTV